jgi:PAS domain-containing protein
VAQLCWHGGAVQTGDNKIEGVLVVLLNTDLSYRTMDDAREPGDALQRSESTVRALLESAAQAILAINTDGRLVFANDMVDKMFGYNPNELIGQPLELLLPKDAQLGPYEILAPIGTGGMRRIRPR